MKGYALIGINIAKYICIDAHKNKYINTYFYGDSSVSIVNPI
jgi:hypothetical protein